MIKVKYVDRRVVDPGCDRCGPLYGYTVMDEGVLVGQVFQVRLTPGHPDEPHYGYDWAAAFPDGSRAQGTWSSRRIHVTDVFCSRGWATACLRRAVQVHQAQAREAAQS